MKNFSSWLIAIFAFMYWGLRLVGTVMSSLGNDFMFVPSDLTMEVTILFVSFICICFIIKRRLWATLIYLAGQYIYFAPSFISHFMQITEGTLDITMYMTVLFEFIGLIDFALRRDPTEVYLFGSAASSSHYLLGQNVWNEYMFIFNPETKKITLAIDGKPANSWLIFGKYKIPLRLNGKSTFK